MDSSNLDFGSVPAWWGAVTGTLALVISWRSARAAAKERKQKARDEPWSDARQVTISPAEITEAGDGKVRVQAKAYNGGILPISNTWIRVHSKFTQAAVFDRTHQLAPGDTFALDQVVDAAPDPYPVDGTDSLNAIVSFNDAKNYRWQRWADGTLRPVIDMRPRGNRLSRWIKHKTPVGYIVKRVPSTWTWFEAVAVTCKECNWSKTPLVIKSR